MALFNVIKNRLNRVFSSKQARVFGRWKKDGAEKLRYEYDLTQNSVVFDVGGYEGQWAEKIYNKYKPTVHVFEPVEAFIEIMKKKLPENKKIFIHNFGLSDKNMSAEIMLEDNKSSLYIKGGNKEKINLVRAGDFISQNKIELIDVMKINIEGGEYDLMDHLIETGLVKRVKNIQIQFHNFVPNAEIRMKKIQDFLSLTHNLTYQYKFVWENWEKNKQ